MEAGVTPIRLVAFVANAGPEMMIATRAMLVCKKRVVYRCMVRFPQMPVFTIHDSIMTVEEWGGALEEVMIDEFGELGVLPKLKIESYGRGGLTS